LLLLILLLLLLPVEQTSVAEPERGRRRGPRAATPLDVVDRLEQGRRGVVAFVLVVMVVVVVDWLDFILLVLLPLLLLLLLLLDQSGRGRDADVQGLDGVGFGLAVCAVVFGGRAVGFDYVFFLEFCKRPSWGVVVR